MRAISCTITIVAILSFNAVKAEDIGTAFTAQALLADDGVPVNNAVDIQATLFDAELDGAVVAGPVQIDGVEVVNGILTWEMDFGADVFNGQARFIELAIRNPSDPTDTELFETFDQRIRITPAPEAINAQQSHGLTVPALLVQGDPDTATLTVENTGDGIVGAPAIHAFGDVDADGNLTSTGLVSGATLDVLGDANVGGSLLAGPTTVFGDADVVGNVDAVDVNAQNNLTAAANLNVTGDGTIGGLLNVTGNTMLAADLDVGVDATVGNDLDVANNVDVGGNLDVVNDATIQNDLAVTNNVTVGAGAVELNGALGDGFFTGTIGAGLNPAAPLFQANSLGLFVGDTLASFFEVSTIDGSIGVGAGIDTAFSVDGTTGDTYVSGFFSVGPDASNPIVAASGDGLSVGEITSTFFKVEADGSFSTGPILPTFDVDAATGNTFINGSLELKEAFIDGTGLSGTDGQYLTSRGTFTEWADLKFNADVDAGGHALINIGTGGSSFGGDGGLNLKAPLDLGGESITSIGSGGSQFFSDGSLGIGGDLFDAKVFLSAFDGRIETEGSLFVGVGLLDATFTAEGPTGSFFADGDAHVKGAYHDTGGSPGTNGQILASTETGTQWINPPADDDGIFDTITVILSSVLGSGPTSTTDVNGTFTVDSGAEGISQDLIVDPLSTFTNNTLTVGLTPSTPFATMDPVLGEMSVLGEAFLGNSSSDNHEVRGTLAIRPDDANPATIFMDGAPGDLHVMGAYFDSLGLSGTVGQVLSSTATGTLWKDCDCDGGGGGGGDATFENVTINNTADVHQTLTVGNTGTPTITMDGPTGNITTDGSVNCGFESSNFLGSSTMVELDISGLTDVAALAVFGFNTIGPVALIENFASTGLGLDVLGGLNTDVLTADVKKFKIDHPLDPANYYLQHASVESSEMLNVYSGNAITDDAGLATVHLPDWFEALNTDFRYQLTTIGSFSRVMVAAEIENGTFVIASEDPGVKVSWQVTGERQDTYALAHPLMVEEPKPLHERGLYRHPELYGLGADSSLHRDAHARGRERMAEAEARKLQMDD